MIQYAFTFSSGDMSSGENAGLKEGTAQWAQDYVSSNHYAVGLAPDETEHNALGYFFPYPEKSLDSPTRTITTTAPTSSGSGPRARETIPRVVRQVWNAVATQKSLAAAKSIFGSGWAQAWKDFERTNWNKDPVGSTRTGMTSTTPPKWRRRGSSPPTSSRPWGPRWPPQRPST